ncbi:MAG TPA: hypothetical protein VGJ06_20745 [Candidatus Acidoferrum sp.]
MPGRAAVWLRWALAAGIVAAVVAVAACDAAPRSGAALPFTSADGAFGFHYSPELVKCEAQDAKVTSESVWAPAEACRCNDPGGAAVTAVCFGYPKDKFKDKPTFNGASFFVATDTNAGDASSCMAGSANWGDVKGENTTIGSATFRHFVVSDAAMSHYSNSEIYRGYRAGKCYELVIQEMTTNPDVYDAGTQKFSKEDETEVRGKLLQALQSFRLLK